MVVLRRGFLRHNAQKIGHGNSHEDTHAVVLACSLDHLFLYPLTARASEQRSRSSILLYSYPALRTLYLSQPRTALWINLDSQPQIINAQSCTNKIVVLALAMGLDFIHTWFRTVCAQRWALFREREILWLEFQIALNFWFHLKGVEKSCVTHKTRESSGLTISQFFCARPPRAPDSRVTLAQTFQNLLTCAQIVCENLSERRGSVAATTVVAGDSRLPLLRITRVHTAFEILPNRRLAMPQGRSRIGRTR